MIVLEHVSNRTTAGPGSRPRRLAGGAERANAGALGRLWLREDHDVEDDHRLIEPTSGTIRIGAATCATRPRDVAAGNRLRVSGDWPVSRT